MTPVRKKAGLCILRTILFMVGSFLCLPLMFFVPGLAAHFLMKAHETMREMAACEREMDQEDASRAD